jgi:hypothetical protein
MGQPESAPIDSKRTEQFKGVVDLIRSLMATRFYGSVEIKFEDGRVTIGRKTESIKF